MRRAAKVDANQDQIVSALRAAGASVQSLAAIGKGCPDLLAARAGKMFLLEVKDGKAEPNELQKRWHIAWNAEVHVVRSPDEALRVVGVIAC
jgi:Holliday junction resolvase